ncbi:enoyl-CoA hydratase/isomerase [mine drainage metagenome]|uniref:Enoyl-CoA hydratase/isomerase n=1 Tax=mine drainage metagenome TaxID=410659 RepID=T1B8Z2_9ZZZZ
MATNLLECRVEPGVVTLTLNRPEVRNALDGKLVESLLTRLERLAEDRSLRALVLRGSGSTFSSGADLATMRLMADASPAENLDDANRLLSLIAQLNQFPTPTLALVQGPAFGGALGLIAACDIALAASTAHFALSEVRLGLAPAIISPYLARAMGFRNLRRYMLTGELFDAEQARRMGLIQIVAPGDRLEDTLADLLGELLKGGPEAIRATKALIRRLQPVFL